MPEVCRKQPSAELARGRGPEDAAVRMCLAKHTQTLRHRAEHKNKPYTKWGSSSGLAVFTMSVTRAAALPSRHINSMKMTQASTGD